MVRQPVLHVEDDLSDRFIVASAIQKAAPEVDLRAAIDGKEAVDCLAGQGRSRIGIFTRSPGSFSSTSCFRNGRAWKCLNGCARARNCRSSP